MFIHTLQQFFKARLGRAEADEVSADEILEAEILKNARQLGRPVRPIDVERYLQIGEKRTKAILLRMLANQKLSSTVEVPTRTQTKTPDRRAGQAF
ncbi:hypothetical protein [Paenibacillus sp. JDR-2]|uniref:hypothetical protein n=1 Tax=Paenibacillus sp. (strain JDR-2) TaxID=324057 RepID=UPI00016690F8|nr:hypothetical protein [Paenibacillus sp. JDR-2]ACT02514.1 hypothetical protein Pjdr2_3884 [Paenibacillus sp. JDR-2]